MTDRAYLKKCLIQAQRERDSVKVEFFMNQLQQIDTSKWNERYLDIKNARLAKGRGR